MAEIEFDDVVKRYPDGFEAVKHMNLEIGDGELIVLVGPSGCGKSTALRMIAGLEDITEGDLKIGGEVVNDLAPKDRDIAMVFQNYALYPHMSVRDNMGFALKLRKEKPEEINRRVTEAAKVLDLEPHLDRKPANLSGGQRQRVSMGRAIVREPKAFLMDEPLSNLDAKLRVSMRAQLSLLHQRLGTTTVYVTHDQVEAMTLGQRVVVLRNGILQQYDTPQRLFRNPVNLFVAAFIGSPSMNFAPGSISRGAVRFAGVQVPLPDGSALAQADREVIIGVRPTGFEVGNGDGRPTLTVVPEVVEELGDERMVIAEIDARRVDTDATRAAVDAQTADDALLLPDERARFTIRMPSDQPVTVGAPLPLAISPGRLYFFDPETGDALA